MVAANGLLQRGGDSTFPFHQDANFWYLTGIDEPDAVLVIDEGEEYLILPELSQYQEIFDGSDDAATLTRRSGIADILPHEKGWEWLGARLKQTKRAAILKPNAPYLKTYGMYTNPARAELQSKIKDIDPAISFSDVRETLAAMRMIKQPAEIVAVQSAIDLTIDAMKIAKRKLPKLEHEYALEAEITGHALSHGAIDAWKPIVAGGKNACTLHSRKNNSPLKSDELVVVDVGAEIEHYAADITRTWSIGGQPTKRQQAVYDAVLEVQKFAFDLQKPGALIRENEQKVEAFMGEKLRELGLIKTAEREEIRTYFPHATSHFLGLEPHDAGDYEEPLKPGTILTVEPGIYIPEENIGIRIEDDVLIAETGHKILSSRLPRTLS